jgi:hypothetical protein
LGKLMDVVDAAAPSTPRDFGNLVDDVFVLLAQALAKLPPAVCEEDLRRIECGDLREAVMKFESRRQSAPDGARWLQ